MRAAGRSGDWDPLCTVGARIAPIARGKFGRLLSVHAKELDLVIFICAPSDNIAGYEYGGRRVMRSPGKSVEQLQQRAQDTLLPFAERNHLGWRVLALSEIFYSELSAANA